MTTFELSWADYESSRRWLFTHAWKSQEHFDEDVKTALKAVGEAFLTEETHWLDESYSWVVRVPKILAEYGYSEVKPDYKKHILNVYFGMSDNTKDIEYWVSLVGEDLTQRVMNRLSEMKQKWDEEDERIIDEGQL